MVTILTVTSSIYFFLSCLFLTRHRAKQKLVSKEPVTSQQGRARLPDEFSMKHGESIAEG